MRKLLDDVAAFHRATDTPILDKPQWPPVKRADLRFKLIAEEYQEVVDAYYAGDLIALSDGLADLAYVIGGMALEFGIPLDRVWDEVQRSNMSKLNEDGKAIKRRDGKVLKGPNYSPPNIAGVIGL